MKGGGGCRELRKKGICLKNDLQKFGKGGRNLVKIRSWKSKPAKAQSERDEKGSARTTGG